MNGGLLDPLPCAATLVAVEGSDGAGKSTVCARLVDDLRAEGRTVVWCPNVSFKPVRDVLDDIALERGHPDRFALLGADLAQLVPSMLKWRDLHALRDVFAQHDSVVVVDRYFYSHLALAEVWGTGNGPLLRRLSQVLPTPAVTVLLDVEPEVAAGRVLARGRDVNTVVFLSRFRDALRALPEAEGFRIVDATRPPDAVYTDVLAHVRRVLNPAGVLAGGSA